MYITAFEVQKYTVLCLPPLPKGTNVLRATSASVAFVHPNAAVVPKRDNACFDSARNLRSGSAEAFLFPIPMSAFARGDCLVR